MSKYAAKKIKAQQKNLQKKWGLLYILPLMSLTLGLTACTSKESLKTMLKNNPEILAEAIEANPSKIIAALNSAAKKAQGDMEKNREAEEAKAMEESLEKPLQPEIRADELIRGPKDAPLTLVIYSDFECPYCARGFKNEQTIAEKYSGKIRVIFKHLPLPMHPQAMVASQYYEAVRIQNHEKAEKFHDKIFMNQQELQKGETFLKALAKELKVDMAKLAKDVKSDEVKKRIQADADEASKFGFQGTPGYLLNGIPVRGAYPPEYFVQLVEKLVEKGKVKL